MNKFKILYNLILQYDGHDVFDQLIFPWIKEHEVKNYFKMLEEKIIINPIPKLPQEDLFELYAFNRILDLLTLNLQSDNNADGSDWKGHHCTENQYINFIQSSGLEVYTPKIFQPVYCEILEAESGKSNFEITQCGFPCVKLKNIILKRAGVKIMLDENKYQIDSINNSTVYWAHWRKNRKFQDQSLGWGSNSQWRTSARLDIETDDSFIYNIYGNVNLNDPTDENKEDILQQGLNITDAIELTRHRLFISSGKDDSDLYPYEFRYEEKLIPSSEFLVLSF